MKTKTKLEILNEVAGRYNINTRSTIKGGCAYTNDKGRHCAVGQYFKAKYKTLKFRYNEKAIGVLPNPLNSYLLKSVQGYDTCFWSALQGLHDFEGYWTKEGLSEFGKQEVENIKKYYIENED